MSVTLTLPGSAHLIQVGLIPGYAKVDPTNGADRFRQERRIGEVRWRFRGRRPSWLTRTLAREEPSPADDTARQPAQTGQVDQRRILSTLGVIATTAVVATTRRRRALPTSGSAPEPTRGRATAPRRRAD